MLRQKRSPVSWHLDETTMSLRGSIMPNGFVRVCSNNPGESVAPAQLNWLRWKSFVRTQSSEWCEHPVLRLTGIMRCRPMQLYNFAASMIGSEPSPNTQWLSLMPIRDEKLTFVVDGQELAGTFIAPQAKKGPGILFVHGWGASQHECLEPARAAAELGCLCLIFDLRGHGLTKDQRV